MHRPKASTVAGAVLFALVIGVSWPSQALAGFGVEGRVSVSYDNSDHERTVPPTYSQTYLADQMIGDGAGETHGGDAEYIVDIGRGLIQSYNYAYYYSGFGAQSLATGRFWEQLTVTVEPGYYPDGVDFATTGSLNGTLIRDLRGGANNASITGNARVGADSFSFHADLQSLGGAMSHDVDEVFTLTNHIVAPGTTLSTPLHVILDVDAELQTGATADTAPVTATADFMGTFGFDSVSVPQGVTWTSDSGVFLPEPTTGLSLALGALALLRRRRS